MHSQNQNINSSMRLKHLRTKPSELHNQESWISYDKQESMLQWRVNISQFKQVEPPLQTKVVVTIDPAYCSDCSDGSCMCDQIIITTRFRTGIQLASLLLLIINMI